MMRYLIKFFALPILLFFPFSLNAQSLEELMQDISDDNKETEYVSATFKASRIVNTYSVELAHPQSLLFVVNHRFGSTSLGIDEFYGLDLSTIRFGFEYGLYKFLSIGIGRSTYQKTVDTYLKFKILNQSQGHKNIPLTAVYISNMYIRTAEYEIPGRSYHFYSRLNYVHQLLLARKFSHKLSIQFMPTYIHRNLVKLKVDENEVFAVGFGGRYKLSNRITLNAEYYYLLPGQTAKDFENNLSIGVDIETGGHIFQITASNSRGINDKDFIPATSSKWSDGDIYLGFNISRSFDTKKKNKKEH